MVKPKVISFSRIWDAADHNALTDLIFYKGNFYCCFREADQHAAGDNGKVRILKSSDAVHWSSVALLEKKGVDLRDPVFSEMPDGRLMLNMGGSVYEDDTLMAVQPRVSFSTQGDDWSPIKNIDLHEEWIWRITWHKGIGYSASYHCTDLKDLKKPWTLALFSTKDGIHYTKVGPMEIPGKASETTLRFDANDRMIALIRRTKKAGLGVSSPPYTSWEWLDLPRHLGGPNYLVLPDGQLWVCARIYEKEPRKKLPRTALGTISPGKYKLKLLFPSGGDTSYPGMVYKDNRLYISYYSSHEEKTAIYFAIIEVPT